MESKDALNKKNFLQQKNISHHDAPHSDDESDDEVEHVLPQGKPLQGTKQRTSVSAEAYGTFNKKGDFKSRIIPKTEDQKARIVERLSKAFMFAALENKEKDIIVDAMEEKKIPTGQWVINQGDDGDNLYVVDEGILECYKKIGKEDPKLVKVYGPGESFGELALLYNAPRAASIKSVTDSVLFALDRETFNHIVKHAEVKRRERFEQIMSKIELLSVMDPYERSKIADVAVPVKYKNGETIIKQGDIGDKFYFVESGTAKATKVLAGKLEPEIVYEYKSGDYFGELALLKNEPRAANVIATSDLTVLALDREAFTRVLGPLQDILKRNIVKYDRFM